MLSAWILLCLEIRPSFSHWLTAVVGTAFFWRNGYMRLQLLSIIFFPYWSQYVFFYTSRKPRCHCCKIIIQAVKHSCLTFLEGCTETATPCSHTVCSGERVWRCMWQVNERAVRCPGSWPRRGAGGSTPVLSCLASRGERTTENQWCQMEISQQHVHTEICLESFYLTLELLGSTRQGAYSNNKTSKKTLSPSKIISA